MLLYDLPYHPRPEIPDSVSAPDMTIPSDSIEAKPFISHQLEKQDTTQLPADTTTTIPIIEQSDTTICHTQLPEQVPAFPANDTLVPGQRPIPVISDTIRQAAGDSSYLLSTDTATVPEQSFPDIQAQTRTDSNSGPTNPHKSYPRKLQTIPQQQYKRSYHDTTRSS